MKIVVRGNKWVLRALGSALIIGTVYGGAARVGVVPQLNLLFKATLSLIVFMGLIFLGVGIIASTVEK